jgi:hypothetical protein
LIVLIILRESEEVVSDVERRCGSGNSVAGQSAVCILSNFHHHP